MALESEIIRKAYSANGSSTSFSFPYYFLDATDLDVYTLDTSNVETLKSFVTDYDVIGNFNALSGENDDFSAGANVVFTSAPASGLTVVILRNNPDTQDTSLSTSFNGASGEYALDKIVMMIQYLKDRSDRSIRMTDPNNQTFDPRLPNPITASVALATNSTATGIIMGPSITDIANAATNATAAAASALAAATSATSASGSATSATASAAAALVSANAAAASAASVNPMTTLGDMIRGGAAGATTRLAGDTTNTRKFLRSLSAAGVASAPVWDTILAADVPTLNQSTSGTAAGLSATLVVGSGGTGVASVTTAPTATSFAGWDANKNLSANNFIEGFTTTATAAGTTTMTIASTYTQVWTGVSTQTVKLPTTSVVAGQQYLIENRSSGAVTVQSSGANTIQVMIANTQLLVTALVATPTTAANWDSVYSPISTVPIGLGGTGATTKAAGFDALSPMTTGGDVIVGGASGTGTRLANGSLGTVLTAQGGTSAPIWSSVVPALNYAQAYFDSTYAWNATSTGSFTDLTNTAVGTFTVRNSSGITVTAAGSNLPGITFTPNASTAVYFLFVTFSPRSTPGQDMGYQLTDGTNIFCDTPYFINNDTGTSIYLPVTMGGIYVPGAATAKTVKITCKSNSSPIGPVAGYGQTMEWSIIQIK